MAGRRVDRATLMVVLAAAIAAVSLGTYGQVHTPTGAPPFLLGFADGITMKVTLTSVVFVGALIQFLLALRMYGRIGSGSGPSWLAPLHRGVGVATVATSLPVAANCLYALGFQAWGTRVLLHSLLGCLLYGAFVAKVLSLRLRGTPGWLTSVAGGVLFASVVGLWLTSSLWFYASGSSSY